MVLVSAQMNGVLLSVMWQSVWMRRESGGKWIHVYVWLSPFAVCLKLSQQCYLDIQNTIKIKTIQNRKVLENRT